MPRTWKLYCALGIAGGLAQMLRKLLTDTGGPSSRYAALVGAVVLTAVLVAKFRGQALGRRWIWQIVSVLLVVGWLVMGTFTIYLGAIAVPVGAALLGVGAGLALPAVGQVWVYAWRSREVWH